VKRGTPEHPKMKKLARLLNINLWGAVGIMESLWHFAQRYAPTGDVGKFTNEELADALDWKGDPEELVSALVESRWLDNHDECRLCVHDWADHCDRAVTKYLAMNKLKFVVPRRTAVKRTGVHECAPVYTDVHESAPSYTYTDSEPYTEPAPEPEPVPTPVAPSPAGNALRLVEVKGNDVLEENMVMLRECGVEGLALSFLPSVPGMTPDVIREEHRSFKGGSAPPGILIKRLLTRFNTSLPSAKSIAPELQRIQAIVKNRSQRYP
jgi:hypothetical protein